MTQHLSIPSIPRRPLWAFLALALAWSGLCPLVVGADVYLNVGADFQSVINAQPAGTHFIVRAGVHRGIRIVPRNGDIISGEPGAVLNGCLELANWRREGQWWVHDVPVLVPEISPTGVYCADMICTQTQDLYVDDERLYAVRTQAEVVGNDHWFLNRLTSRIYMRRDPTGREVELGGPSPTAIDCSPPGLPARQGVIIEDLVIEKYPTPPQIGAVRLGGNSICRRCEIRQAHSHGIQLMGAATVQDCYLHDNGMCGIGGAGIGATIEGCEISENVWSYYAGVAWDKGGMKIAGAAGSTIRRCYVHHNHGPGIWTDIGSHGLVVEDNVIEFNDWEGVLIEISDHIIIRRNICRWNGVRYRGEEENSLWGAQICIQNANHIEVASNYLECGPGHGSPWGSGQGVMAINQNERVVDEGVFGGDFSVHNLNVHHNVTVIPLAGHSGVDYGTLGWATYADFLNAGLSWHDNRYLARQPLELSWSWRLAQGWNNPIAKWCQWEEWKRYQDAGSTVEAFGPDEYQPTGNQQWGVIREVTGHDYPAFKAGLTRRPPPSAEDGDGDGVPDVWERNYFGGVEVSGGSDDPDGDGWNNAREFSEHTDPTLRDADGDGLLDPWEVSHGLDPNVFDSETDADLDGRSAREEYEDGTDPAVAQTLNQPVPEANLSLWLETASGLVTGAGGAVQKWIEHSPHRRAVGWTGTPAVTGTSPTGRPLVDPGTDVSCPGNATFWGTQTTGFTMTFVYQPTSIDLSGVWKAILTNEDYLHTGFRLRLEAGYLVLSSGQSGGILHLSGHTRLEAGRTYVISINSAAPGGRHALYLDGTVEAWQPAGLILPSTNFLLLGSTWGVTPQPGRFGDVVVFDRALSHRERRTVESLLRQKFQTGYAPGADRDLDGLPDAYEQAQQLDPLTPDAQADDDQDGALNVSESEHATNPHDSDTDDDGLLDGWEIDHDLNPLVQNDSDGDGLTDVWENQYFGNLAAGPGGDPDGDGWHNAREYSERTNPTLRDTDADGLPDPWEPSHGLDPTIHDSDGDADLDGRSAREEFEDGTDLAVAQPLDRPVPEANLSLWLETAFGLVTRAGGVVESWVERSPHRQPIGLYGTPAVTGASPTGRKLVDPGTFLSCPGNPAFWGTPASGFTMTFVYQPTSIDLSSTWKAILTNETYLQAGFRLRQVGGRLVWAAGLSGGTLELTGQTTLEAGRTYVISMNYAAPGGRHALYLDGKVEASLPAGTIGPSANAMMLGNTGGSTPQPGRFGDVVVFDRALSHRERRTVERLLSQKFLTGFPPAADRDFDGLPDTYEQTHQFDPLTPDAQADDDHDGAVNLSESQHATNPHDSDSDDDGLLDGWEIDHGLNPLSQNDSDGDGLTDIWENQYFGNLAAVGTGDHDGDGWNNAREFNEQTDPTLRDTDADGLPDPWEADHGLDPTVADSDADADLDGRSAREEFEDGTDPAVAQALDQPVPEATLSLWLETVSGLVTGAGGAVTSWTEHSPHRRSIELSGAPVVTGSSPTGRPLVDPGIYVSCPGAATFWGTQATGFTMTFVYQPTSISLSGGPRALLTNERFLQAGFRLRLDAGCLVLQAGQSGGTLYLVGHTKLQAGHTHVISIDYAAPGGRHALYLDGNLEASLPSGLIVPSAAPLALGYTGGVTPQPGRFGDVVVFGRALSHRERRTVERLLSQKFLTGFAPGADRDLDGLTDLYELAHQLDPLTPDAQADDDHDGALNVSESQHATHPHDSDTDDDALLDGWEIDHGLNPLVQNDSDGDGLTDVWENQYFGNLAAGGSGDPDGDGWDNAREYREHTNPTLRDTDADGPPDPWEASHGLDPNVFDSDADADLDGRSAREEFEDGTDPAVAQALDQPVPEATLSLWLETVSGLVTGAGGAVTSWTEHSPDRRAIASLGAAVTGTSPTGRPLVDPGAYVSCPSDATFWGTATTGFTMTFIYRPTSISLSGGSRAILTNEVYLQAGFRLRLDAGVLILNAGQSGGNLYLPGRTRLEAGRTYVISVNYAAPGGRHALYLDGNLEASLPSGSIVPSAAPLALGYTGGVTPQPGRFGDVVVFDRALSHRERRTVERLLHEKFVTGFPARADRDLDEMPDAYELAHQLDPLTPDGWGDEDHDGTRNLLEFQQTNPPVAPTNHATWAGGFGLAGVTAAANADPDLDGLMNGVEYVIGSNPAAPLRSEQPAATSVNGTFVFTFPRVDSSESADVSVVVEVGPDLTTWPTSYQIGSTTASSSPGVTVAENGAAPDTVTLIIPRGSGPAYQFARLKVTVRP